MAIKVIQDAFSTQGGSKQERSLLLFFECCEVDDDGWVKTAHMNEEDFELAKLWADSDLIKFGRLKTHEIDAVNKRIAGPPLRTHYVRLTSAMRMLAAMERSDRAERCIKRAEERYGKPEGLAA